MVTPPGHDPSGSCGKAPVALHVRHAKGLLGIAHAPSTKVTSKLSDSDTNAMLTQESSSKVSIEVICRNKFSFYKNCQWSAVGGLGGGGNCVQPYNDAGGTSKRLYSPCNDGSQGIGSHCHDGPHDLVDTYCSHCPDGTSANSHGRTDCGHDNYGYGHQGALWVR